MEAYNNKEEEERAAGALRPHVLGKEDGQRWAGVGQEEEVLDWLHDCWFAAVAGDAPSFEAWPAEGGAFSLSLYLHMTMRLLGLRNGVEELLVSDGCADEPWRVGV